MTQIRRLDHIAVAVRDTELALTHFSGRLGLAVVHQEVLESPPVRLTYLDAGNAFLQLVEPLDTKSEISRWLDENGEGLHHICFGVDDVAGAVRELSSRGDGPFPLGQGRGRPSGFVADGSPHGVVVECTEFHRDEDVDGRQGWLSPEKPARDVVAGDDFSGG